MKKWMPCIWVLWLSLLTTACGDDKDDTVKPDDTPPSPVVSTYPPNNATDVAIDAVISATFKEDMDSMSINNTTFTLGYNPLVSGTVAYDKGTRTATFTPDSLLNDGTTYTATLTTGIKNSSGIPLATDYSWRFIAITCGEVVYLPRTGQTRSWVTGDDGDIKSGVVWPTPRFTDNGDGTITDELTDLMWLKDGECLGQGIWQGEAYHAIDTLNLDPWSLGCQDYTTQKYHDWRLPNVNELESLFNAAQSNTATWLSSVGFIDVQPSEYWTSTTYAQDTRYAWFVNMWTGFVEPGEKRFYQRVWAVRGESCQPAKVWKTGQVTVYRPGDDGDLQEGARWPVPRFLTINLTALDYLTDLVWATNADTPTYGSCTGGLKTWQEALEYIECLNNNNYAGSSDWRLPNRKELFSLLDREQINPPLPSDHDFEGVQLGRYWTSTTYAYDTSQAWMVDMRHVWTDPVDKTSNAWVWPVRGGR
jgi:hypothetical protein